MDPSPHITRVAEQMLAANADPAEAGERLLEAARVLRDRARTSQDLVDATYLYEEAADAYYDDDFAWARVHAELGIALRRSLGEDLVSLHSAADHLEHGLRVLRGRLPHQEVAELELQRGLCLHGEAVVGMVGWREVIRAYRRAIICFADDSPPARRATAWNNLGTAICTMDTPPQHARRRMLTAAEAFREAASLVPPEDNPVDHGLYQANLATALLRTPPDLDEERLREAIDAMERALASLPDGHALRTALAAQVDWAHALMEADPTEATA